MSIPGSGPGCDSRDGAGRVVAIEHLQAEPAPEKIAFHSVLMGKRKVLSWRVRYMVGTRATGYLCHTTICGSTAVRNTLIQEYGYPPVRTVTILNGIDVKHYRRSGNPSDRVRTALGIGPSEKVLLCVARLTWLKRVDILLQAISIISRARSSCKCIIVGGGFRQHL